MTREHTKALIPVLVAWSEGRDVQASIGGEDWEDQIGDDMDFDNKDLKWRVKPKPREFWVVIQRTKSGEYTTSTPAVYFKPVNVDNDYEVIHVREVVE